MHFGVLVELPALHPAREPTPSFPRDARLARANTSRSATMLPPLNRSTLACVCQSVCVCIGVAVSRNYEHELPRYPSWRDYEAGSHVTRSLTNIPGGCGSCSSQLAHHRAVAKRGRRLVANCLSSRCGWQSSGQRFARGSRTDRPTSSATPTAGNRIRHFACSEFRLGTVPIVSALTLGIREQSLLLLRPNDGFVLRGAIDL